MAQVNGSADQSGTERIITMVKITVIPNESLFYYASGDTTINVVESLGTLEEGKDELENNPEFDIATYVMEKIRHKKLNPDGDNAGKTNMKNEALVKFSIESMDEELEVCPPSSFSNDSLAFKEMVIKLKDIPKNKTTEYMHRDGRIISGTANAYYPHYNYERKGVYNFNVCVELNNYEEIFVEKAPQEYICGKKATNRDLLNKPNSNSKTAVYIMKATKPDGTTQADPAVTATNNEEFSRQRKLYWFKDENGFIQGPLSTAASSMDQLSQYSEYHYKEYGVKVPMAYVRYDSEVENGGQTFTPLYPLESGNPKLTFRINKDGKRPSSGDKNIIPFQINVTNSIDSEKGSPQAYIGDFKENPANQTLISSSNIQIEEGVGREICYVYADHADLDTNENRDVAIESKIPRWHPHHLAETHRDYNEGFMGSSATRGPFTGDDAKISYAKNVMASTVRKVHPFCKGDSKQSRGTKIGTVLEGYANGTDRYGTFAVTDFSSVVFLDLLVEHNSGSKIDVSGHQMFPRLNEGVFETPLGQKVTEYVGTRSLSANVKGTMTAVENTQNELYKLHEIHRHQDRGDTTSRNNYYTKAKLKFGNSKTARAGQTYEFTVVGVSNKLATLVDLSYNKNMVDKDERYWESTVKVSKSVNDDTQVNLPQPYQKYVYDPSQQRVVTYGCALDNMGEFNTAETGDITPNWEYNTGNKDIDVSGQNGAIIRPYYAGSAITAGTENYTNASSLPYEDSSGALFCCRSHFTVVVTKSGEVVNRSDGVQILETKSVTGTVELQADGTLKVDAGLDTSRTHFVKVVEPAFGSDYYDDIEFKGGKWQFV